MLFDTSDWQLEYGQIRQRAAHLLVTEQWADCGFLVGLESEQVHIKAHKLILGMASPVFEAMFYGPMAEGNEAVPIPDIQPVIFHKMLEYIYTDNIELDSFNIACELYYAAQKYMLPHLLVVCTIYLSCNLNVANACRTYEFAQLVGEKELLEESVKIIQTETKAVLADSSFEELEPETIAKLFSIEPLTIDSELELFAAAERYAKSMDKRISEECAGPSTATNNFSENVESFQTENSAEVEVVIKPSLSEEKTDMKVPERFNDDYVDKVDKEKSENRKSSINSALKQIRFLTLSCKELAEYETLTSLLTESEILSIFMNIASTSTHMAMPSGFSTCRSDRRTI